MKPQFFPTPNDFRKWLTKKHSKEKEILVGYYKVNSHKPSINWSESVDQALCFGWIDGIRRSIDEESYCIRFTPRKPKSNWSKINIKKIAELKEKGLLKPAGIAAFDKREEKRSGIYSYEKPPSEFSPEFAKKLRSNKKAYKFFSTLSPSIKKVCIHWVMSAKQEKTRISRMERLIASNAAGIAI